MKLVVIILVCGMLCIGGVSYIGIDSLEEEDAENIYQGPVPQGYNLNHFRTTGETVVEIQE